jgi:hypothetical protein
MNLNKIINDFSGEIIDLKNEIANLNLEMSKKERAIREIRENVKSKHTELVSVKQKLKINSNKLMKYEKDCYNKNVKIELDSIIEDFVKTRNKDIDISCLNEQYVRRFKKTLNYKKRKLKSFLHELGYETYKVEHISFIKTIDVNEEDDNIQVIDTNFDYFHRLKRSNYFKQLYIMGKQGKKKKEWTQYFEELEKESEVIQSVPKTDSIKLGFIAEYMFQKLFIHNKDKRIFIGYLNNILAQHHILDSDEFIIDFQSLKVKHNQPSIDIKLNLILNNGKNFFFPIEMKSITNNEASIKLSGPYYSYYLIINQLDDDFSTKLDSFYLASPMYIIEKCFDIIKFQQKKLDKETLKDIWKKRIRRIEENKKIIEIKLPISNRYYFIKEDAIED